MILKQQKLFFMLLKLLIKDLFTSVKIHYDLSFHFKRTHIYIYIYIYIYHLIKTLWCSS